MMKQTIINKDNSIWIWVATMACMLLTMLNPLFVIPVVIGCTTYGTTYLLDKPKTSDWFFAIAWYILGFWWIVM